MHQPRSITISIAKKMSIEFEFQDIEDSGCTICNYFYCTCRECEWNGYCTRCVMYGIYKINKF